MREAALELVLLEGMTVHYNSLDWSNPGGPLVWSKEEEKQYTLELYKTVNRLVEVLSENNVSVKVHETLYKSLSEHVSAGELEALRKLENTCGL